MEKLIILYYFLIGLCAGSFANAVIYRLPRGLSPAQGRSFCPCCNKKLSPAELIPLVSYFLQKGKCASCKASISVRYPAVELMCGVLSAIGCARFGSGAHAIVCCAFFSALIAAAFIDAEFKIIPNEINIFLAICALASLFTGSGGLYSRVLGALSASGFMLLLSAATRGGIGGGDIKLMAASGLFLGLRLNILAFFSAYIFAFIFCIVPLLTKKVKKNSEIPMGGFFAAAIIIASLWGNQLTDWYFGLFF